MTETFETTMVRAATQLLGSSMEAAFALSLPAHDGTEWLVVALVAAMTAQQRHPEWGIAVTRQYEALVRIDFDTLAEEFVHLLPVTAVY